MQFSFRIKEKTKENFQKKSAEKGF